jgi:hypothetical protein
MRGFNPLCGHNIAARDKFLSEMSSLAQQVIRKRRDGFPPAAWRLTFPSGFPSFEEVKASRDVPRFREKEINFRLHASGVCISGEKKHLTDLIDPKTTYEHRPLEQFAKVRKK